MISARPAKNSVAAGQQCHQGTRCQADAFHPLGGARQAIAAEPAEEFLRTVGGEDDADNDAQDGQAVAGAGGSGGF